MINKNINLNKNEKSEILKVQRVVRVFNFRHRKAFPQEIVLFLRVHPTVAATHT